MRGLKTRYAVFASPSEIQRQRFVELLASPTGRQAFNEKFFDFIEKRRGELGKTQNTIFLLQIPVFGYLALVLSGADVNLSVLGIAAGKNLREALVVLSAGVGLWAAWANNEKAILEALLKARIDRWSKGNKAVAEYLYAGYGLQSFLFPDPVNKLWHRSWYQIAALIAFTISLILLAIFAGLTVIAAHFGTLLEVYRHPNFSPLVTKGVIGFVVLSDLTTLAWTLFSTGILPFSSGERLKNLSELQERNPQRYDEIITQIAEKQVRRGRLHQTFIRPRLPKKIE